MEGKPLTLELKIIIALIIGLSAAYLGILPMLVITFLIIVVLKAFGYKS